MQKTEWQDKLLAPGRDYRPGGFSDVISTPNLAAGLHAPQSGAFMLEEPVIRGF